MIWFACKQCGKRMQRPEEQGGTLVFCACGQPNRVPWESTVAAEAQEEAAESRSAPGGGPGLPRWGALPRWREKPRRDPAYCLNHPEAPSAHTCADCGEGFCANCLATLQDLRLCAPCKAFRIRRLHWPARPSIAAILAAALGMVAAPIVFLLTLILALQPEMSGVALGVAAAGLILPAAALVIGVHALRDMGRNQRVGGRSLALIGIAAAVAAVLWCVTVVAIMAIRMGGE